MSRLRFLPILLLTYLLTPLCSAQNYVGYYSTSNGQTMYSDGARSYPVQCVQWVYAPYQGGFASRGSNNPTTPRDLGYTISDQEVEFEAHGYFTRKFGGMTRVRWNSSLHRWE